MNKNSSKNKTMKQTALITGASMGLGAEFARLFAEQHINLVLVARNKEKLLALAENFQKKHGIEVKVFACDLSQMNEVQALYDTCMNEHIQIDFLINNAGFGDYALFHQAEYSKLEQMIDLNIKALTKLSHLLVNQMIERGFGRIMHVASTAAFQPGPTMAVYFATKAYVLFLGEAMSNELEGTGVTVTTFCPGATETGFQQAADLHESKLVKNKKLPGAAEVAEYGFKAMMKGELTPIHGTMNYINAMASRFLPRKWVLKIVRMVQDKAS
jgi:hypothetical protein